jgi:exodeoxyribonuclease VII large subunit
MLQSSFIGEPVWSVSEITHQIRLTLVNNLELQNLWVQGEISNITRPTSGHLYFTLKDSACTLRCVMWRNSVNRLKIVPREGEAVEVHGNVDVYEAGGQYQFYADQVRPYGEGLLFREFLLLKEKLENEGLFDPARKRPIPRWPKKIGVVTSPTGAAFRDILNTIRRRYPLVEVYLSPTQVQGEDAPQGIVDGLEKLNRLVQPDVILVVRGGGSMEDLWAFNHEMVARAIAASPAPVITGVGHETDFTIADFVSDLRAPTPTASAELATPNKENLMDSIQELVAQQHRLITSYLSGQKSALDHLFTRLKNNSPQTRIQSDRQRLDELFLRLRVQVDHMVKLRSVQLTGLRKRLESANPETILNRGYAIVSNQAGNVVSSTYQVKAGEPLNIHVIDGDISVNVSKVLTGKL